MDRPSKYSTGRWYNIQNKASGPTQVMIYGDIGDFGISSDDFVNDLKKLSGDLEIHINTNGGVVSDGVTIYNALKRHPGNKTAIIDGYAASIGSVIAMAGDQVLMAPGSMMMIHEGQGVASGDADEFRKVAEILDKHSESIAGFYANKTGAPSSYWRNLMKQETWFTAQEAVQAGLADGMTSPSGVTNYYNADQSLEKEDDDGDADDDSSWDGSAAMSDAAKSDNPAASYKAICAGKRDGDPSKQTTWALPHHKHPGSPPNEAGVKNALARLPQTQGLVNKSAAQAHLEEHMRAINPDYDDTSNKLDLAQKISDSLKGIFIG